MLNRLKKKEALIFLLVLAFLFVVGLGIRIINYPPRSTHIWRQSECLAFTKTYFRHHTGLFTPATYNLAGKDGKLALSEFPILYYTSAKLCSIFGFHYWVIRGLNLLCYILGLYYLLRCCRIWISDFVLALFPVIILASSPFYFFYAVNYLPNVPAISFAFAGLYYLLRFRASGSVIQIAKSTFFVALACLLKPTDGGIMWLAATPVLFVGFVKTPTERKKILPLFASFAIIFLTMLSWYLFVKHYDSLYYPAINSQDIYPIWSMPTEQVKMTFYSRFTEPCWRNFQHGLLHLWWLMSAVVFFVKWKAMDRFLRSFILWMIFGVLVYSALWFDAFMIHDYYELIYAIPVLFISIAVLSYFETTLWPRLKKQVRYGVYIVLVALMVVSIYHNQYIQLDKYDESNMAVSNPAINEVEPFLRKLGISEKDPVLSVPDASPNISLVAFGNPGFTSSYVNNVHNVPYYVDQGIKYLIVADSSYLRDPLYQPYTTRPMGEYKGIYVFDIRKTQ